jgi:hypothetical protein
MQQALPEPWRAFLAALDRAVPGEVQLHCLGGFVMTTLYGMPRPTADVDVFAVTPWEAIKFLAELGGRGTSLHQTHRVYLDFVTVPTCPDNYEARLTEMFAGAFSNLRLFALDAYDLALAKLERNSQRDREDVFYLADRVPLDIAVLRQRYREELRPYLGNPAREDLTLDLWVETIEERRASRK